MKLRTIAEKVGSSKPVVWLRTSEGAAGVRSFVSLCRENPFPVQCALLLFYRAVLDFMYLTQLSPLYAYSGFTTDLSPVSYGLSWLLLLTFVPLVAGIQGQECRPSSMLVTTLNLLYFIPMTSYVGCKGSPFWFLASVAVYWLIFLLLQLYIPSFTLRKIPVHHGKLLFLLLTVGAVLLVMGISGVYTGFRLKLDISDVYNIRAEAAAYDIPTVLSYALSWMTVVLSIVILYWLREKKYWLTAGLIVVYFFYYSIGAHKSVFLFLLLLLACYFLYHSWMLRWSAGFLSLGVAACWIAQEVFHFLEPMSLFVRRFMYVPVQLSEIYAVYFTQNPLNLLREGFLGKLGFDSVYSVKIPMVIGEFAGSGANANNGMVGDMYANLPAILGVLLFPLILIIISRLLDLSAATLPQRISISFCAYYAISFSNTAWGTTLLSEGLLLACVLLYLFPTQQGGRKT